MGFLRFILAVSVLIYHSQPIFGISMLNGTIAVQSFFIISGFYMALILNEKYIGKGYYKLFIQNRFLKLFPLYWLILFLSLLASLIHIFFGKGGFLLQNWLTYFNNLNIFSSSYLFLTNIFIFGQDLVTFSQLNPTDGMLAFATDFTKTEPQLHTFLLVPQAWSISLELFFYILAPFIVRKNYRVLLGIVGASLLLRIGLYSIGLNRDPWTYRFFPTEIAFFIFGVLSYKIYVYFKDKNLAQKHLLLIFAFVCAFLLLFPLIPGAIVTQWVFYAILTLSIGFIFIYTKNNKFDRFIGELSYPMYLTHILILRITGRLLYRNPEFLNKYSGITCLCLTILTSIVIIKFVMEPLERYRQNRYKQLALPK